MRKGKEHFKMFNTNGNKYFQSKGFFNRNIIKTGNTIRLTD